MILVLFGLALAVSFDRKTGFSSSVLMSSISIAFAVFAWLGYIDIWGYAISVGMMVFMLMGERS